MFLKNNKGFSMLEILVSVGIVSLLIGVAAPAYNQYKKHSTRTALQSDISNLVKAYNAYNAVNASYCASLDTVGFTADGSSALYQKQAYSGFEDVSGNCTFANMTGTDAGDKADIQVRTSDETAGTCSVTTHKTKTACEGATETWTADSNMAFTGTPTSCVLQEGEFLAGATTGVSALGTWFTMDEDGRTNEAALADANDPNSGDCTDPA